MQTKALITRIILAAGVVWATCVAGAASIGINFLGDGGDTPASFALAPDNEAGVVPQTNWNNILSCLNTPNWGLVEALGDDSGQKTTVSVLYQANDAWHSDGPQAPLDGTTNYNYMLMHGILKASAPGYDPPAPGITGDTMYLTVGGLPAGDYDIYAYCADNGTPQVDFSIGSKTNYITEINAFDGAFVEAISTDPDNRDTTANYCLWTNVPADTNGKILIVGTMVDRVADGMGICGLQIVKKSAGPFPTNQLLPVVTQQPFSTYSVVGGTASFAIGLNGPWMVQWRKNGSPIPGATNLS